MPQVTFIVDVYCTDGILQRIAKRVDLPFLPPIGTRIWPEGNGMEDHTLDFIEWWEGEGFGYEGFILTISDIRTADTVQETNEWLESLGWSQS